MTGGLRFRIGMAEAAYRNDIPSGLNRIRTRRYPSEEPSPSSSGGDDSPAKPGFLGGLGRDGPRVQVLRGKDAGKKGLRSGRGKGFRKGRKLSHWFTSYFASKDSNKSLKSIPSSCEAKRSNYLPDFKEMTEIQLLQEGNSIRKANGSQKSFSHELGPTGGTQPTQPRSRSFSDLKELLYSFHSEFEAAKEAMNVDLAAFSADAVSGLEKGTLSGEQETAEYLIFLSKKCMEMKPSRFQKDCEGIVQDLTEKWQKSQAGCIKQLLTRMLFILTRCNRILQFQRDVNQLTEASLDSFKQCIENVPAFDRQCVVRSKNISNLLGPDFPPKHETEYNNKVSVTSINNTTLPNAFISTSYENMEHSSCNNGDTFQLSHRIYGSVRRRYQLLIWRPILIYVLLLTSVILKALIWMNGCLMLQRFWNNLWSLTIKVLMHHAVALTFHESKVLILFLDSKVFHPRHMIPTKNLIGCLMISMKWIQHL